MTEPSLAWTDAGAADTLAPEDVVALEVEGREIAVFGVDGQFYATDNICTHGHARLCDGFLLGEEIECPLHQGRFDVRTGQPSCEPVTDALRTYPIRIEGGRVFVALSGG
ncbi:non-heme iron oxygenase ferredoxin subunit [Xenophilus aerolatus]|nr:non-heme iron oxygenase ferredoxin subunit [Xenophilus aerolatus]